MEELFAATKGAPWYVLMSTAAFASVFLFFFVRKFISAQGVGSADDKATLTGIGIFKDLVEELKDQLKSEQAAKTLAEQRADELLLKYSDLSGQVAAMRLQIEHQTDLITKQDTTIVALRDELKSFKERYYATANASAPAATAS
jgi:hypothetical protein